MSRRVKKLRKGRKKVESEQILPQKLFFHNLFFTTRFFIVRRDMATEHGLRSGRRFSSSPIRRWRAGPPPIKKQHFRSRPIHSVQSGELQIVLQTFKNVAEVFLKIIYLVFHALFTGTIHVIAIVGYRREKARNSRIKCRIGV